ncbi:gliding motility protein GldM [Flavobacterium sp.]|uniref:type IX secretion system motor protein PorM/GldM n=1 Tax=Flavobacterium sp. TaxID=239 RepID=UPI00260203B9|nr:gliding motility protein GldM [Flavobacterium sp.]MDD2985244.1 gliding motility protein GldM [Flavobacterium sp.]
MAGGKLTPRQKMINLMYLVFIAMLALNMSKEVLSAFGLMNEKFEDSNTAAVASNAQMLSSLDQKASEAGGEFATAATTAHKVEKITKAFYDYIAALKTDVLTGTEVDEETGKLPYEAMDKADNIDHLWFSPSGYSPKGQEIMTTIEKYKTDMKAALGTNKKLSSIVAEVDNKFDLAKVKNKDGVQIDYLDYHFKGFPAIASLAKLSAWQGDIKKAETDVYNTLLGKAAVAAASYSNYQAIVVLDKNAYFQGETVTGKVVLGRYDANTTPTKFVGPGKIENGQAVISLTAGAVGEQNINGQFSFMEDGKEIPLKFEGKYVVVPQPKEATISADKMNVVYRGVVNPMTISFAGVSDVDVTASAPGLSRGSGVGKYNMSPGQGTEAVINVTAKLPGGKSASSKKVFRIKGIPAPVGAIGGEMYSVKGAKSRLEVSQVMAKLPDFDFDVQLNVTAFTFKVPGQAAVIVSGDRVNAQCKAALARAGRGDVVTISDIKTQLVGSSIMLPRTAPVIYEIQ